MESEKNIYGKQTLCFPAVIALVLLVFSVNATAHPAGEKTWLEKMAQALGAMYDLDIPPERISLQDAAGNQYTCIGHYAYPENIETSGLFYHRGKKRFYTVADKNKPHIYEFLVTDEGISIQSTWKIKKQRNLDFEGIDWFRDGGHGLLAIACERTTPEDEGRVLLVNPVSRQTESTITVPLGKMEIRNTYLEGIAIDNPHKRIYLVKERQPPGLYMLDFEGEVLATMAEKEITALYRAFADKHDVTPYMGHLVRPSFSGLDYEEETGLLVILNRSYRQIILARNRAENTLDLEVVDIFTFRIPENNIYGNAEGVAVADFGKGRSLLLTTDPGAGETPTLTIFDFPPKTTP